MTRGGSRHACRTCPLPADGKWLRGRCSALVQPRKYGLGRSSRVDRKEFMKSVARGGRGAIEPKFRAPTREPRSLGGAFARGFREEPIGTRELESPGIAPPYGPGARRA